MVCIGVGSDRFYCINKNNTVLNELKHFFVNFDYRVELKQQIFCFLWEPNISDKFNSTNILL